MPVRICGGVCTLAECDDLSCEILARISVWSTFKNVSYARGCFPALLGYRGLRRSDGLALRQHFDRCGSSPFDPSNDGAIRRANGRQRDEPVLAPQAINQPTLTAPQHLLWKREEIAERPYQQRTLKKIGLQVSRAQRRVEF